MTDEKYMNLALTLATKGIGFVNPNPLVGAVIVKDGKIIGQGWHEKYGGWHAERNALSNCSESPNGASMYVTLEPCCHYGKTPPCTEAILQNGIKKVVIGSLDPNTLVSGKGVAILREAGIDVVTGILQDKCIELNEVFFHYIKTKTPYVVMKYAMTMDGKIASASGKSKWITGQKARVHVHKSRNQYSSIMVGVGTVIADNPSLTCRIDGGRNPIRIICDTYLRTPLESTIVTTAKEVRTIIATACNNPEKHKPYLSSGCEILEIRLKDNHIDLNHLMQELGAKGIDSILLEGGSSLNFSALQCRIVNKVQAYIAPKLFGGSQSKTPVGGVGIQKVSDCFHLKNQTITWFDEDILMEGVVDYTCLQESSRK
ncbi:bifunctional diaminohydroxyphosphoribosylaminopyrimidine deaminase/5-amino-6-(5-phosphoribosylamino)uracil reductase RibD [Anaerocolumna sp. MB42-C2]|uniref:bifunctional diaminohydroxyphosphoribosylaminopyrimidine deaminase/5-amino-6-(5-phosphoribosylamino)uracil reductase RibD n=1 Tax=Anaerocolumna sp. MB42-C2 TaxID=3070997 RepID=UPI0027E004BF|nr:bifunctional diaminohydroxyphosphoribosylaminopyrimidine deaminase/5-amino-6-(5-phosphoribosylamino)uracil reductase RibD [Anaerocolumna sp. MB42-C2]WMJ88518.1 bifunctional diaminohydroxyphosphoribosylaminopyrimidine deaminase/5-amino-6-(5-phosphoribosylamino)uracil reductase RibD [Anaerocolumna sp. MB42-C2]